MLRSLRLPLPRQLRRVLHIGCRSVFGLLPLHPQTHSSHRTDCSQGTPSSCPERTAHSAPHDNRGESCSLRAFHRTYSIGFLSLRSRSRRMATITTSPLRAVSRSFISSGRSVLNNHCLIVDFPPRPSSLQSEPFLQCTAMAREPPGGSGDSGHQGSGKNRPGPAGDMQGDTGGSRYDNASRLAGLPFGGRNFCFASR